MKACILLALIIIFAQIGLSKSLFAEEMNANFEISQLKGNQWDNLNLNPKITYIWAANAEGARTLKWKVLVDTSWDFNVNPVAVSTSKAQVRTKGNRLQLTTEALSSEFKLKSGLQVRFLFKALKPVLIEENCKKADLAFQAKSNSAPFYLGVSCVVVKDQVTLHLSFPAEANLIQSSLFETQGKGENFRVYDLKKITAARGTIGSFLFSYGGQNYEYSLMSLKKAGAEDGRATESRFTLSLGYGNMTLKSVTSDFNSPRPFAVIALRPRRILGNLAAGVNFENSIGSTDSANPASMSYFQVAGYATYILAVTDWLEIQPRLYYVISNQSSGSGVGYQTGQVGFGLWNQLRISQRFYFQFEGMTEAISSPVITAHYYTEVGIFYRDLGLSSGWGAALQLQKYSVADSLQNARDFGQIFYILKRSF